MKTPTLLGRLERANLYILYILNKLTFPALTS
jgi:hypothetical protein